MVTPLSENLLSPGGSCPGRDGGKGNRAYPVINFGFSITTKLVTRKSAPAQFKNRITARKNPIIAWNISGEITQKSMPIVRVVET